jgi:trigger factor
LKIETQQLDDHQVKLSVEIEPELFEQAKRHAAKQIARKTKIPGFRPGKAPFHVVQRFVGESAIFEDGLEILVKDNYPKFIEQAEINPYGPGSLEKIVQVEPLTLEFTVPLAAEVKLGDYQSMRFPYEPIPVSEADIQETLSRIRESQAVEEPVDRPAQEGDRVFIRLKARNLDSPEGQDSTLIPERQVSFILTFESDSDAHSWPFPGFTKELIGLSPGDKKELNHTFSDDVDFENLQGVSAEFSIEVEEVKSRSLPEVDDEFAQTAGDFDNVEAMLQEIRKQLEEQAQTEYDNEYNEKVVNRVVEISEVKFPPQMLEDEINEVIHNLEHRLRNQNIDLETYMKIREIDEEGMREEARPIAESRLKQSLVLVEISKVENIELDKDEVQQETARALDAMTSNIPESELKKIPKEKFMANLVNNVIVDMRLRQTVERLQSIAKGEYPAKDSEPEEVKDIDQEMTDPTGGDEGNLPSKEDESKHEELVNSEHPPIADDNPN